MGIGAVAGAGATAGVGVGPGALRSFAFRARRTTMSDYSIEYAKSGRAKCKGEGPGQHLGLAVTACTSRHHRWYRYRPAAHADMNNGQSNRLPTIRPI